MTGLTNGTAYTFTVTATNSAGTGSASAASAPAITGHRPRCARPAVTATSNANTQSVVSWTAPASNGGAAISSYTATSTAGRLHLLDGHHQLHGDRADQRHRLHLHGHRHQLGRHQRRFGRLGGRHSGHHRRCARPR